MKRLLKKSWFMGVLLIVLTLIVFLINLWVMSLKLKSPFENDNFWALAGRLSEFNYVVVFAFIMTIVFYISIIPLILSVISFIKKNNWGFFTALIYYLGFNIAMVIFQSIDTYMSNFALFLVIINILIISGMIILFLLRKKSLDSNVELIKDESKVKLSDIKIPFISLVIDLISITLVLTTFFIPLYTVVESASNYNATIIRVLLFGDAKIELFIFFIINFAIFLAIFLYFAKSFSYYFFDKETFIKKSKRLVTFSFLATLVFFLMGLSMLMYSSLQGNLITTLSFIPLLLMSILMFVYSIFEGKYNSFSQNLAVENTSKYAKVEPLLYILLLTAVTVLMLFLKIVKIDISSGVYENYIHLTGIDILRDYASLDAGYAMIAFMLVVMLISVGLCLVLALTSYLSKNKQFYSLLKLATIVNVLFVFIIAISGYYFQIAKEINHSMILDIFAFYGLNLPLDFEYDYKVSTDAIYALLASVLVLVLMFTRKSFDKSEMNLEADGLLSANNTPSLTTLSLDNTSEDDYNQIFDPSPAFTELDSKIDVFKKDFTKRKQFKPKEISLNALVNFVVEYARNSRLHLSYTPESIATFVSGLGASKLSILQGMSGTGKTSLPKIFSEAVYGNCEIIEVESSWKDKNELLGYYNEFSRNYTPKKFTLALYKAALNQDIFTFILLDEMNLSRIEYYFSDFLSLMESEEKQRSLKLTNIKLFRKEEKKDYHYLALDNGNTLKIPANVWFIGTANRDESTFVISDKVYDRAHTMNFTKRAPKVRNYLDPIDKEFFDYQTIDNLFSSAKEKGSFDAENNKLIIAVERLLSPYNISFGNRILKQIEDFVNIYKECFPNEDVEDEAVEKILLSKVVAKLEIKTIDDKEKLEIEFEKLDMNQCAEFVKSLDDE